MKELTIEDKQLLLKDLCARLPYGVYVWYLIMDGIERATIMHGNHLYNLMENRSAWKDFKPYLRPMSSMTEEENIEYQKTLKVIQDIERTLHWCDTKDTFDWLNAHHFDYRGLIEKGLALEAPEGMYK